MVDWNDLRYLLAVHRQGTLAGAARELRVTKATAGRRLALLEAALGAQLVERKPRGLTLTSAGRQVVAATSSISDTMADLKEQLSHAADDRVVGTVRATAAGWLASRLLIPALPELRRRYPDLEVELLSTNRVLNLAQREADVALRNVKPTQRSLIARRIGRIGGCVYAARSYFEGRRTPRTAAALAGHQLLLHDGPGGMPDFEWLQSPNLAAKIAFRTSDPVALVAAVSAGLGLAALPCFLADREPGLVRVPTLGFSHCDLWLVTHEQVRKTARVRAVTDFIATLVGSQRDALAG
jgi:DNA-binding transcriptional LysR family regulator